MSGKGFQLPSTEVLNRSPIVVVVFTLKGCGHCEIYRPKFTKVAAPYADYVPIVMADGNDPRFQDLANRLNVQGVPATFLLRKPAGMIKLEGDVPEAQIKWLLNIAAREMQNPNSGF